MNTNRILFCCYETVKDLIFFQLYTLQIFSLQKLQVFTVSQIPLQFHCIFYRQPTVNIFLQFLHSIFALFVCKKCSETAVGFVPQWKPVVFAVKILAVRAFVYTFYFLCKTWLLLKNDNVSPCCYLIHYSYVIGRHVIFVYITLLKKIKVYNWHHKNNLVDYWKGNSFIANL